MATVDGDSRWQQLMNEAYDKWQKNSKAGVVESWTYAQFLRQLSVAERRAVILGNLNYQVENGGFSQWVDNGYASDSGVELLEILPEMGEASEKVGALVQSVLEHVDMGAPKGSCDDHWEEPQGDDFDYNLHPGCQAAKAADDLFYALQEDWHPEVQEYLRTL